MSSATRKREYYNPYEHQAAHSEHYRPTQVVENRRVDAKRSRAGMSATDRRRVNAVQGLDITQKYDAFGNNSFTSADNPWAAFFGTPAHPYKTTSYDKYDRHNYNLPEAYVGKNEMIAQTIDELIYSDETYYTSVLLPYNFTDNLSVAWDKWEFNEHFTGIVPEQGVSRLVSSTRESRSESFLRRGLGAMWEHGFMSTREGRANYFMTLAQIARAVQETTNFGVIYAYLTCHNYNKTWEERHGYFRRSSITEILERERFMWAIAVKMEFGMEKLDAQIVEWMDRYRSSADTWLLPVKPATYLRLVPAEKVYQYLAGDMGPARVNDMQGAGRNQARNGMGKRLDASEPYAVFKNNNVFITRTYHVQRTGPIDLMMRISSVGEFFKMVNNKPSCDFRCGYNSCMLDRRVYDESGDTGFTVSAKNFIDHGQLFNEDGTPRDIPNNVNPADIEQLKRCFFVRPFQNTVTGLEECKQIDFMGDMDPQFFGPGDAHKLAMTAVGSAFRTEEQRKQMQVNLDEGMRLIEKMGMEAPLVEGEEANPLRRYGARTTWQALRDIVANAPQEDAMRGTISKFVDAVSDAARMLGPIFGGMDNLFLGDVNRPDGKADAAQALYDNLLNTGRVPLYAVPQSEQQAARESNRAKTVENLFGYLQKIPLTNAGEIRARALSAQEAQQMQELQAAIEPVNEALQGLRVETPEDESYYRGLFMDVIGTAQRVSWKVTNGKEEGQWKKFLAGLSNRWDSAMSKAKQQDVQESASIDSQMRTSSSSMPVRTEYAISRNNPHYLNGSLRAQGFVAGSISNHNVPENESSSSGSMDFQSAPQNVVPNSPVNFMQIPLVQNLMDAADAIESDQASSAFLRRRQQGQGASTVFRGGRGAAAAGLHQYEDNLSYGGGGPTDTSSSNIGALYDYSPSARERHSKYTQDLVQQLNLSSERSLRFGTLAFNVESAAKLPMTTLERIAAFLYYGTRWHRTSLDVFYDNNVMLPFNGIGARIGLYEMALGIKCQAGGGTGYTYFGHSNFMLADDAAIKMHYGNYTHYGKSVIHDASKVFVAYDIFPNRCLGGMGTQAYERADQYDPVEQIFQADIFYMMVAFTETRFPTVMSLTGRFDTFMDAGMIDDDEGRPDVLHYSTCAYYKRVWRWRSEDDIPMELDEPMYRMYKPGHMYHVWQGAQGSFNPHNGEFDKDIIRNKSPWGPNVYEGCRGWRNGLMERIQEVPHGKLGF